MSIAINIVLLIIVGIIIYFSYSKKSKEEIENHSNPIETEKEFEKNMKHVVVGMVFLHVGLAVLQSSNKHSKTYLFACLLACVLLDYLLAYFLAYHCRKRRWRRKCSD